MVKEMVKEMRTYNSVAGKQKIQSERAQGLENSS